MHSRPHRLKWLSRVNGLRPRSAPLTAVCFCGPDATPKTGSRRKALPPPVSAYAYRTAKTAGASCAVFEVQGRGASPAPRPPPKSREHGFGFSPEPFIRRLPCVYAAFVVLCIGSGDTVRPRAMRLHEPRKGVKLMLDFSFDGFYTFAITVLGMILAYMAGRKKQDKEK